MQLIARWLFWGSLGLIIYTYIGFPLLNALRGTLRPRPIKRGAEMPSISMIVAAYNEGAVIVKKLDNTFALNYPRERIQIVVASDGSDDGTNDLVAGYGAPEVHLLVLPRQGKNRTLNDAVAAATGDILVFSDADSMLAPDALRHLVAPFVDPEVGGVGGDFHYASDRGEGEGERTYWSFDRTLKQLQSRAGSITSATGQIYAMRQSLFKPLPLGVTDDFFTSIQVPAAHRRLVFEPQALAYGPVAASSKAEFRRKVRVMTAGLRGVWMVRRVLNPFEYGFFAIQLWSHKVLRRLMVLPLIVLCASALVLWPFGWLYQLAAIGQLGLHGAGLLGFLLRKTRLGQSKVLSLPFFFDMVNAAAIVALVNLIRGERHDIWVPQRSEEASGSDTRPLSASSE
jgi:cellulose synthase/poly-beta-1,6-N-acetylglucosamine synthase-like glycosyltransferase